MEKLIMEMYTPFTLIILLIILFIIYNNLSFHKSWLFKLNGIIVQKELLEYKYVLEQYVYRISYFVM